LFLLSKGAPVFVKGGGGACAMAQRYSGQSKSVFPRNKSITSWRGQSPLCRVVSKIPLQRLVSDLLATRRTILTCQDSSPCK